MSCDGSLCRGVLPVQSKANGMVLDNQSPELSCLNVLEQRLVSLCVLFMKMVALPCAKQMMYPWSSSECALQSRSCVYNASQVAL